MAASNVIANLKIMLSASWNKLKSDFNKAGKTVKGFSGNVSTMSSSISKSLTLINPKVLALTASLGALGLMVGGAKWGVQLASDAEQAEVALSTMLGSMDAAKTLLSDLEKFAAATPFGTEELVQSTRQLTAFGVQAGDIMSTMKMLGDLSSGIGAPLNEIAEIFGKAKVQGRLFAEDINQFQGRGIPIVQALADTLKTSTDNIREMVKDGKVGFTQLQAAFQHLTSEGSQFGGMMEKQSQTLHGLWSTFTDELALIAKENWGILNELLKEMLRWAIPLVKHLSDAARNMRELLGVADNFQRVDLATEAFKAPAMMLDEMGESLKQSGKELKKDFIDIASIARDVSGMRFGGPAGAFERRTTEGFSAALAAQREVNDRDRRIIELGKRILEKMDQQIQATKESAPQVTRRRV
ncbi:tape measure protein [Bremerella sp. T1]|uniref:tape measure protein n=1 Tax=Bremerella sp. TYQ1 TaxID=3119568 RepID=UPI001CCCC235|nr:tape measure protein [Bremerella volcania]UBM37375.1 tape measure protein [Bremerella volcania]